MTPKPARHIIAWTLRRFGFAGVALAPFGIFILAEHLHSQRLIRHEQAHWRQYQRLGLLRYYVTYLWGLVRHGYADHPMEREPRAAETDERLT
jgi:hypothetical protein